MNETTMVSKWGNSKGIRIPVDILRKAEIELNDKLYLYVDEDKRIILTKKSVPKKGTLEYLFKDYTGEPFLTELINLGEPMGNEKW